MKNFLKNWFKNNAEERTKENKGLTEKEFKELELLDNPEIEFMGQAMSPAMNMFNKGFKKRRERVINLRTKMRMTELNLDYELAKTKHNDNISGWHLSGSENSELANDLREYDKIIAEEEERFDKRFSK
jgi:hypothetical protein